MADVTLVPFFHPSMQIPFKIEPKDNPFTISSDSIVADLMDKTEEKFEELSKKDGKNLELQINVIWNTKDHKKALNPNDKISLHFADGETFGIYGDMAPAQKPPVPEANKTPVVILTGFLGSGKTTLLNYILEEQTDKKIAVIENEFGEVSIDDALLKQNKTHLAEKIVVMDNGCMCCTIRGDLKAGLEEILAEMHGTADVPAKHIDLICIETTGMADPVPIVRTFMTEPSLTDELRLDGVVALADAKHLCGRLDDDVEEGKVNEAYQQIAFADKIILNKLDLVTTDEAISIKDRIRSINAFAKILPAVKSRIKLDELSNMRAHDMAHFVDLELEKEADVDPQLQEGHGGHSGGHDSGHGHDEANCGEEHGHGGHEGGHGGGHGEGGDGGHGGGGHGDGGYNGHGEGHGKGHAGGTGHGAPKAAESRHDNRVNSFSIIREGEIIPKKLSAWMQSLGSLPKERGVVFRIKAILAVKGHPNKHVFHAVMDVSDEDDAAPWEPDEKKVSKIVFIGKGLDQKHLRDGFEAIFEDAKCQVPAA